MKTAIGFSLLCVGAIGFVLFVMAGQPEEPPKRRLEIISEYERDTADSVQAIVSTMKSGKDPDKSDIVRIKTATDTAFIKLSSEKLMTNRLETYQTHWTVIKKTENDSAFASKAIPFSKSLVVVGRDGANKVSTCTVVVSASNGDGAVIRYIKSADLAAGGKFKELGVSTVLKEVERAEYVFKCFRKEKETGSTQGVACTDTKMPVKISIQEN